MANEKEKQIEIIVKATVDDSVSEEQVADRVQEALKSLASGTRNIGDLGVRTVPRATGVKAADAVGAGYESRLWEKATC